MNPAMKEFDEQTGHRYFAASGFNRTWELIDLPARTDAENEQMLLRAYASLWHWTQRADCTPRNLSVGYWLISRVHALLKQAGPAKHFGELSLESAEQEPPFYKAYAYEALARAAMEGGDRAGLEQSLQNARQLADQVTETEDRSMLLNDLETIQ